MVSGRYTKSTVQTADLTAIEQICFPDSRKENGRKKIFCVRQHLPGYAQPLLASTRHSHAFVFVQTNTKNDTVFTVKSSNDRLYYTHVQYCVSLSKFYMHSSVCVSSCARNHVRRPGWCQQRKKWSETNSDSRLNERERRHAALISNFEWKKSNNFFKFECTKKNEKKNSDSIVVLNALCETKTATLTNKRVFVVRFIFSTTPF